MRQAHVGGGNVNVTYIGTTPERIWQALTDPAFSRQYFAEFAVEVEPHTGGTFLLRYPDGRVHISGLVLDWSPPCRFSCTWLVEGIKEFSELPECIVAYEVEQVGAACRLTITESHSWDVPDAILADGRSGWPAILSGLKSLIETGKPLEIAMAPPPGLMDAVKRTVVEKPWARIG